MTSENSAPVTRTSNWTLATGTQPGKRAIRKVVVASNHADDRVLQIALSAEGYDVVLVESLAHAYSQVKRIAPNLVIVCLEIDDVAGFQVLSMLKLDSATRDIPLVTYTTTGETRGLEDHSAVPAEKSRSCAAVEFAANRGYAS